jgi:hypothetical protein
MKPIDPPAMVREAEESIGQLATKIRAHLAEGAEAFRKVGQKLEKAYKHFKDPNDWEGWLHNEFGFGARQARKYRRLAKEWDRICQERGTPSSALGLKGLLDTLTEDEPESEDTPKSEGSIQQPESTKTSPVPFAPTIAPAIPAPPDREPGSDDINATIEAVLCKRCKWKGCPSCNKCRAKAWKITLGQKDTSAAPRKTGPKPGKPFFSWTDFHKHYGEVARTINNFGKVYKVNNTPELQSFHTRLAAIHKEFKAYTERITKEKAPLT